MFMGFCNEASPVFLALLSIKRTSCYFKGAETMELLPTSGLYRSPPRNTHVSCSCARMVLAMSFLFHIMASLAGKSTAATNSKWQRSELVNTIGAELPDSRSFVSGAPHEWNVAMTLQLLSIGSLFPKFARRRE